MEDFQAQAIPHFNSIFRVALRLTKNRAEAGDLTEQVYQQAFAAFRFYKPEINCRVWLLRILFRKFYGGSQKNVDSELVRNWHGMLKSADYLEIESNKKSFV